MSDFTVEFEFDYNTKTLEKLLRPALKQATNDGMEKLKELAEPRTPKKTGNLRAATQVSNIVDKGDLTVESGIENSLDYAVDVHEIERNNYTTAGTGSKFFEQTVEVDAEEVITEFAQTFKEVIE